MEQRDIDKLQIKKLQHGEKYIVPESDYGKAEIWMINNLYFLFSIPEFGGTPAFHSAFLRHSVDEMIERIYSWT